MQSLDTAPVSIAFDASVIIGLAESHVAMIEKLLSYFEKANHFLVMCQENLDECQKVKGSLTSPCIRVVSVKDALFKEIKELSQKKKIFIEDNDYKCIATAVQEKCSYIVSNDILLLIVADEYKHSKRLNFTTMTPANLFWYMHISRKDLFNGVANIGKTVQFYHHVELPNTYIGIKKKDWIEKRARERFSPYATNIHNTIKGVTF